MNNEAKSKISEFVLLTFCISWICWGTVIIANKFGYLQYGTFISMILFLIGGNGAPIASYILLKKWKEIDGFKSFLKRNFNFKSSVKNYGLVLTLLLVHFIIPISLASTNRKMAIYYGLLMIPMNVIGGGLEEIGWRGILQPYLEMIMSFSKATIIIAVIWIMWHIPLWFIVGTYQSGINFFMFSIAVFGMTFSLAVIRKITHNVFLCILFHSCINSFITVFMPQQNFNTILTMVVEISLSIIICILYKYKMIDYRIAK